MNTHGANKVTVVGHSLGMIYFLWNVELFDLIDLNSVGGAIALISSVYLPLHLPSGTTFRTITYGMPRVCSTFMESISLAQLTRE